MSTVFSILFLFFSSSGVHRASYPRFGDYPVKPAEIDTGLSAGIRFPIASISAEENVGEIEHRKADFAGHFIIAGGYALCGTGCLTIVIVDARTGKIYDVPFTIENCCGKNRNPGWLHDNEPCIEYKLQSKLLVIRGARNEKGWGTYFYTWNNNRLKLIRALEGKIIPAMPDVRK